MQNEKGIRFLQAEEKDKQTETDDKDIEKEIKNGRLAKLEATEARLAKIEERGDKVKCYKKIDSMKIFSCRTGGRMGETVREKEREKV